MHKYAAKILIKWAVANTDPGRFDTIMKTRQPGGNAHFQFAEPISEKDFLNAEWELAEDSACCHVADPITGVSEAILAFRAPIKANIFLTNRIIKGGHTAGFETDPEPKKTDWTYIFLSPAVPECAELDGLRVFSVNHAESYAEPRVYRD